MTLHSADAADQTSDDRTPRFPRPALLMGKWKPARTAAIRLPAASVEARVRRSLADDGALERVSRQLVEAGKTVRYRDTPPGRVPMSTILVDMMRALYGSTPLPTDQPTLQKLATWCAAAWTASRLDEGTPSADVAVRGALGAMGPGLSDNFDRLVAVARLMHPADRRVIASVSVELRDGELRVNAVSVSDGG